MSRLHLEMREQARILARAIDPAEHEERARDPSWDPLLEVQVVKALEVIGALRSELRKAQDQAVVSQSQFNTAQQRSYRQGVHDTEVVLESKLLRALGDFAALRDVHACLVAQRQRRFRSRFRRRT